MGRKSFEEIGRPLPNRKTILVSNTQNIVAENCTTVKSLFEAFDLVKDEDRNYALTIVYKNRGNIMNNDLKIYLENTKKTWWIMFYRVIWEQLPKITNSKILDFGSGIGITANHLAKDNEVFAIYPKVEMVEERICKNSYQQLISER